MKANIRVGTCRIQGYKDTRIQGYKQNNYFIEFTIVVILKCIHLIFLQNYTVARSTMKIGTFVVSCMAFVGGQN